jgi:hypothetical protein
MPAKLDKLSIKTPQVYDSMATFLIFHLNKYFSGRIGDQILDILFHADSTQIDPQILHRFKLLIPPLGEHKVLYSRR